MTNKYNEENDRFWNSLSIFQKRSKECNKPKTREESKYSQIVIRVQKEHKLLSVGAEVGVTCVPCKDQKVICTLQKTNTSIKSPLHILPLEPNWSYIYIYILPCIYIRIVFV